MRNINEVRETSKVIYVNTIVVKEVISQYVVYNKTSTIELSVEKIDGENNVIKTEYYTFGGEDFKEYISESELWELIDTVRAAVS